MDAETFEPEFIPARLCCGKKHWGVVCPDKEVMCCICFGRFAVADLYRDTNGDVWDECRECGEREAQV